ncbi:MAG: hypothetical protein LUD81_10095 [Clostridiales bacterium]|nr:hypothetical protein [Clostridiales bacterium]
MAVSLEAAREAARKAHEALYYNGVCDIIEYQKITDDDSKISHYEEVTVLSAQPCNLSFEKLSAAVQTSTAAEISQGVKLFLSPDVIVKSGSKAVVTQCGVTYTYKTSGEPAVYAGHQEIMLEIFERWA